MSINIKKLKKSLPYIVGFLLLLPRKIFAFDILQDLRDIGAKAGYSTEATDFKVVLANLVRIVIGFVGMIFVILIIWGGLEWMTSGGNEQKIASAKTRIKNATVGLVIVVMAYSIAYTITRWLAQASGSS